MERQPSLFIAHGSPMMALEQNTFTQVLRSLKNTLPTPKAVIIVSAHWETEGTFVLANAKPRTIHDFYGFPKELYEMEYSAPSLPSLAKELADHLNLSITEAWGFDHGVWTIFQHIFPSANIPIVSISLDKKKSFAEHYELGARLSTYRSKGCWIVGSGNIVHNLRAMDSSAGHYPWAESFDLAVSEALLSHNEDSLFKWEQLAGARLSVPSSEHLFPLAYALGASSREEKVQTIYEGFQYGSVSMRSVLFGNKK